jgi:hypothetical protein
MVECRAVGYAKGAAEQLEREGRPRHMGDADRDVSGASRKFAPFAQRRERVTMALGSTMRPDNDGHRPRDSVRRPNSERNRPRQRRLILIGHRGRGDRERNVHGRDVETVWVRRARRRRLYKCG